MTNALSRAMSTPTPQSEPLRPDQVANSAGGYGWAQDPWAKLNRWLVIGTEGGTYYSNERKLTLDNVACLDACLAADPQRVVAEIVRISTNGLAHRPTQAIFALARAATSADDAARFAAYPAIVQVCRTGTHLFSFAAFVRQLKGGKFSVGRGMRRGIGRYYTDKPVGTLALHAVKYRQREGWEHRDLVRLLHRHPGTDPERQAVLNFMLGNGVNDEAPAILRAFQAINAPGATEAEALDAIAAGNLPWEAVPDALRTPKVWEALLPHMAVTATVRQLATLSRKGVLKPLSKAEEIVVARLTDAEAVAGSRIHPMQVLDALKTYENGGRPTPFSYRTLSVGQSRGGPYEPNQAVVAALSKTFELAFKNVVPAGKRTYIGIDVSGSMGSPATNVLSCTEAAAAMALIIVRTEPRTYVKGFATTLVDLKITADSSPSQAAEAARKANFGDTDAALQMIDARQRKLEVDHFITITDGETWAGPVHPAQALKEYRAASGIDAQSTFIAMTSNGFTLADPADPGMLDIAGFSADTPQIVSRFAAGDF